MGFVKLEAVGYEASQIWDHMGRTQIIQIIASSGPKRLNFLQFQYLENRSVHNSSAIGYPCLTESIFNTFTFEGLHEHITKVEGLYHGFVSGFVMLRIHTNVKEYVICDVKVRSVNVQPFSINFGGIVS